MASPNNKKRLFLALNLPLNIKKQIAELLNILSKQNKGVKWVNPLGLHLTLHFLGYLDEEQNNKVQGIMQSLPDKFGEMSFIFKQVGAFPNLTRPRIIFLQGEQVGSRSVFKLQELLGLELIKLGIDIDDRSWQVHITLGRVKISNLNLKLPQNSKALPLSFKITSFELMESELTPSGAKYKEVMSCQL